MSIIDVHMMGFGNPQNMTLPPAQVERQPMQRLAEVRKRQGISRRTVARKMNTDLATVRAQEEESADLSLSQLYAWRKILDVPISELFARCRRTNRYRRRFSAALNWYG